MINERDLVSQKYVAGVIVSNIGSSPSVQLDLGKDAFINIFPVPLLYSNSLYLTLSSPVYKLSTFLLLFY